MKFINAASLLAFITVPTAVTARLSGRTSTNEKPTPDVDSKNLPRMENITAMLTKANRLLVEEVGRKLEDSDQSVACIYKDELQMMVTSARNRVASQGERRHLERVFENDLKATAVKANRLTTEEIKRYLHATDSKKARRYLEGIGKRWDSNRILVGETNFLKCSADTDQLLDSNPPLLQAAQAYYASPVYNQEFDPDTFTIYTDMYYSNTAEQNLRQACAQAGGYFDVNVGPLTCDLFCAVTTTNRFVNCLANTQECRAKGHYEYLQKAMEAQGFESCSAPERPQQIIPTPAPVPAPTGWCDTISCSGRSESSCLSTFGCSTYDSCSTLSGQFGNQNTHTSTCSKKCTHNNQCYRGFTTESTCNAQVNCKWEPYVDDKENDNNDVEPSTTPVSVPVPVLSTTPPAPSLSSQQKCISDADLFMDANPQLYAAFQNYIHSMDNSIDSDPTTSTTDIIFFFSDNAKISFREACGEADGIFDVNVGTLTCDGSTGTTSFSEYVTCLPNTPECSQKGNYEHLQWALENEGFTNCRAPERPSPVLPIPSVSSYEQCTMDTNQLLSDNPQVYRAAETFNGSLANVQDTANGIIHFYYSDVAREELRQACIQAGGFYDLNVGTLTCEYSAGITSTNTGYANCLANTPECRAKGNYEYLQAGLEREGFYNCRTV